MTELKFSMNGAIKFGWNTMKSHFWFFMAVIIISILLNMIPDVMAGMFQESAPILAVIINIASLVIGIIIQMGLFKIALKLCDDEKVVISDLFSCTSLFLKYILGAIIYGLIVFAGMIILVVPGIIWAIKFQYFSYFIIDKKLGPIKALKESSRITAGKKWDLFTFCIVLAVINLIGSLCFLIGLFVTIPMTMVAYAFVYRTLQDPLYASTNEYGQIPNSRWLKWAAVIIVTGFFGMILLGIIAAFTIPSFLSFRNRGDQEVDEQLELPALGVDEKMMIADEGDLPEIITNNLGMKFVLMPAGSFTMGSPETEKGRDADENQHLVTITQPFYLQATEVTQEQWQKAMGGNPSYLQDCDDCPVENVSWYDVQNFIEKLNAMEGVTYYRLPSEAEWEYAARAGSTTAFSFGNDEEELGEYAWYGENSSDKTHAVGTRKPNAWGLYDMHGNVVEWVEDDRHDNYDGAPGDGTHWVDDPRGTYRVFRGGAHIGGAQYCRSANRDGNWPDARDGVLGFRLARSVTPGP